MDSATARTRLLGSDEDYYYTSEDQVCIIIYGQKLHNFQVSLLGAFSFTKYHYFPKNVFIYVAESSFIRKF